MFAMLLIVFTQIKTEWNQHLKRSAVDSFGNGYSSVWSYHSRLCPLEGGILPLILLNLRYGAFAEHADPGARKWHTSAHLLIEVNGNDGPGCKHVSLLLLFSKSI